MTNRFNTNHSLFSCRPFNILPSILTLTPTNCSCKMTQDSKYTHETFVANNAMASVAKSILNEWRYIYVVATHNKQNKLHRVKNRAEKSKKYRQRSTFTIRIASKFNIRNAIPAVKPFSLKFLKLSDIISFGESHLFFIIRPIM